ncbi:P pilus assembly protein, chaperone PapD [Nostoc sp. UHCC 0251]|uniref:P pilus assembly protein, chaperone PapD n=1 Tax=Nostoc sp. UHCC 0251 TaxID=3110240 RepID=UPI002B1EE8A2|nr:P pilus assembly protein, chaperone PapD [Nostoc sp. UHCC 0251]MEA5626445.1 P pilus assembly protein, chaperone PapD [Nostoc sp. UHCC 0251]
MLNNNWRSLAAVSAGLFALIFFPVAAKAQMSVSPLVIEAKAERGQAQGMITISNTSKTPSRIRIYAQPFTYSRDAGFQTLSSSPSDLTKYLQFSPRELTIKPGEVRRVRLISRLAPNLPDGEYRAVVFNETLTESKDAAGNNVTLVARIGVTLYVRKGNLSPKLAIDSASFNPEQKQIQLLVQNSGQATVLPSVNWTLRQGQTVVKTGQVDANAVVANSDRNFLLNYPSKDQPALKPGQYQLSGELFWGEDSKKSKLPFNLNITIPTQTAASEKK